MATAVAPPAVPVAVRSNGPRQVDEHTLACLEGRVPQLPPLDKDLFGFDVMSDEDGQVTQESSSDGDGGRDSSAWDPREHYRRRTGGVFWEGPEYLRWATGKRIS